MTHPYRHSAVASDAAIGFLDRGLLLTYASVRFNARFFAKALMAVLPLMLLLVGSCKTPETNAKAATPAEFRIALFPDAKANQSKPAAGYVARARSLMEHQPQTLKQLTQQEITYMFGAPEMERHDANARIWQYKNDVCVVDFYFYQDAAGHDMPVAHVDYRFAGATPVAGERQQGRCLHKLSRAQSMIKSIFS